MSKKTITKKDKYFKVKDNDYYVYYKDIKKVDHFSSTPVGYKYLVSISIYIDGNMSTFDSHEIADKLEKELNELEPIYLAIIHVNPIVLELENEENEG